MYMYVCMLVYLDISCIVVHKIRKYWVGESQYIELILDSLPYSLYIYS